MKLRHLGQFLHLGEVGKQRDRAIHLRVTFLCLKNPIFDHFFKKRKLRWFGHIARSSGLAKTILQGTVQRKRRYRRSRLKKRWKDQGGLAEIGQLKIGLGGKGLL